MDNIESLQSFTFPYGTVVKINGIPFYLAQNATVLGTMANFLLAQSMQTGEQENYKNTSEIPPVSHVIKF